MTKATITDESPIITIDIAPQNTDFQIRNYQESGDEITKAIIPYNPLTLDIALLNKSDFQTKNFQKKRKRVLNELRCISGLPEIVSSLNPDTLYKLVYTPKGGKLYRDAAGNIQGVFYKNGKIIKHAKFKAVQPSLVKAATAIGSQILLISIAMQLNRIEGGISKIITELHNDRIAEIHAGVNLYKHATTVQDSNNVRGLIQNAIQTLEVGIKKTIQSLKKQIEEASEIEIGFFDNWFTNNTKIASDKFKLAEESFLACLTGIQIQSECYVALDELETAEYALEENIKHLNSCGIKSAARKARLVPFDGKRLPEELWLSYLKNKPLFNNEFDCIEVEVKPDELIKGGN